MKVGYQTISWGWELDDLGEAMFRTVANAHYDGVELAQHPDQFGSANELYRRLSEAGLKLLGLAGGSLDERAKFINELIEVENAHLSTRRDASEKIVRFDIDHPYLYVDSWHARDDSGTARDACRIALHPHMFKPVQTGKEAYEMLRKYPYLRLLFDTGHLTVAGEDVIQVLRDGFSFRPDGQAADGDQGNGTPIVGIHLKDWTSEYGRSYQFYSRGFGVSFGEGEVELEKVIELLKQCGYSGWVVVEQDVTEEPASAVRACRNWLRTRGV